MKAVACDRYGPPEVLRLEDVERPVPGDDQVLVRVRATTVNRSDCGRRSAQENALLPKELVEAGRFQPVIDRTYPLEDVVEATQYVETGQKTGNVVLTV